MLSRILRGAVLATFAVGATVAQADPSTLDFNGMKYGETAQLWKLPGNVGSNGNGHTYYAGLFQGVFDADGAGTDPGSEVTFFCIDLIQYAYTGNPGAKPYSLAYVSPTTDDDIQLQNLFASYGWPTDYSGAYTQTRFAAAMQLAVWNILYDTDKDVTQYSLSANTFKATANSATTALANEMMKAAFDPTDAGLLNLQGYEYTLIKYQSSEYQDFVAYQRAGKQPPELPLPGTLALFGIGLAGLGLARRKG